MCAPDSFRSARCLLRGCPDDGHVNDQPQFPDRNSSLIGTPDPSLLICYRPLPPEIQPADFHTLQVSPTELLRKFSEDELGVRFSVGPSSVDPCQRGSRDR